ncbi:hypothetical protein BB561_006807 [Smittium simulii]|uniref:Uncharacterized protein n=1 Tax=Smittium simulii TaxID=133385 RepID=A0A2T9Y1A0_9FUNG|nr:hypothetical protein BB561_006807 [Smittium simulii]
MRLHFFHFAAIVAFIASDTQGFQLKANNTKTFIGKRNLKKFPYDGSQFTTSCELPNYVLVPKKGGFSSVITPFLSKDAIKVPCNNKYFYMTFDAQYLTEHTFDILLNPKLLDTQDPYYRARYATVDHVSDSYMYNPQGVDEGHGTTAQKKLDCKESLGKGKKYFLAYDTKGIHMGVDGTAHSSQPLSLVFPAFRKLNMLIQAGSTHDNALGIYNIQIKCLAGDKCGVPQYRSASLTLKDLPCPTDQEKPEKYIPDNKVVTVTKTTSIISTITKSFTTTELQKTTVTKIKTPN